MMKRWWIVLPAAALGTGIALLPRVTERDRRLPEPARLSPTVRALLHERMERHGAQMSELSWNVVKLDWDAARDLAGEVAAEPRLARVADPTLLNAELPARFFELQDALHDRALAVQKAAAARQGTQLADAFADLSRVCVSCHQSYLGGEAPGLDR